ncbi:MAG: hypothetical protein Q9164_002458 [Protoblastenia rupestris]
MTSQMKDDIERSAERFNIAPQILEDLLRRASQAKDVAYCPYSNFRVGAALLSSPVKITIGANVENASTPVGICAERCALVKAITEGDKDFKALAVATDITPPGSMREFCSLDMPVFMVDKEGKHIVMTMGELLPMSFGPEMMKGGERE